MFVKFEIKLDGWSKETVKTQFDNYIRFPFELNLNLIFTFYWPKHG